MITAADKAFIAIALALEAETLQGQSAQRAVAAAKRVVQARGVGANQLLSTLSPETQQTLRPFFA